MVLAEALLFRYRHHWVGYRDEADFALRCGRFEAKNAEITGVIGANGSGKTTLLKLLAGLEKPEVGEVWLGNTSVWSLPARQRRRLIGWVHMDNVRMLVEDLMVSDHIALSMIAGAKAVPFFPRLLHREQVEAVLPGAPNIKDLLSLLGYKVGTLSSGQRQFLGNLLGLSVGQNLLIADEGTATLDAVRATEFLKWLKEFGKEAAIPIVVASHDLRLVAEYADAVYVLRNGIVSELKKFEHIEKQSRLEMLEKAIGA